jgi:hypothetical protein
MLALEEMLMWTSFLTTSQNAKWPLWHFLIIWMGMGKVCGWSLRLRKATNLSTSFPFVYHKSRPAREVRKKGNSTLLRPWKACE